MEKECKPRKNSIFPLYTIDAVQVCWCDENEYIVCINDSNTPPCMSDYLFSRCIHIKREFIDCLVGAHPIFTDAESVCEMVLTCFEKFSRNCEEKDKQLLTYYGQNHFMKYTEKEKLSIQYCAQCNIKPLPGALEISGLYIFLENKNLELGIGEKKPWTKDVLEKEYIQLYPDI